MAARNKNINLLLKKNGPSSFSEQFISWALTYGRYIIIITQICVLSVFFARFKLDREYSDLKERVLQKQALLESVQEVENEIKKVQSKISAIRNINVSSANIYLEVLDYLQKNIPSDTVFNTLSLSKEKISFSANCDSLRSFGYILRRFQKESKFSEVTLDKIQRKSNGKIDFEITAKINFSQFKT